MVTYAVADDLGEASEWAQAELKRERAKPLEAASANVRFFNACGQ